MDLFEDNDTLPAINPFEDDDLDDLFDDDDFDLWNDGAGPVVMEDFWRGIEEFDEVGA